MPKQGTNEGAPWALAAVLDCSRGAFGRPLPTDAGPSDAAPALSAPRVHFLDAPGKEGGGGGRNPTGPRFALMGSVLENLSSKTTYQGRVPKFGSLKWLSTPTQDAENLKILKGSSRPRMKGPVSSMVSVDDKSGEVVVWDLPTFTRRFGDGSWVFEAEAVPTADELKDNFTPLDDANLASSLTKEASEAFASRPKR